jgi:hypothetical protein
MPVLQILVVSTRQGRAGVAVARWFRDDTCRCSTSRRIRACGSISTSTRNSRTTALRSLRA